MKNLFIVIAIYLIPSFVLGQDSIEVNDIYIKSLEAHIAEFEDYLPGIDTIFVFKKSYHVTYQGDLNGIYVLAIDEDDAKLRTRGKQSFVSTVISPVKIDRDGRPYILVKDFDVSRKGRRIQFAGSDATWCYLTYDCEEDKYSIVKK